MSMAADFARYKHVSLGTAATSLARGTQGSVRAFEELGITLDTHVPKQQAIAKAFDQLKEKIGGQAVAYTHTLKGQMEVLGAEVENVAEKIGGVLIPVLQSLIEGVKSTWNWFDKNRIAVGFLAAMISTVLVPAVTLYIAKLGQQAVAFAIANWELTLTVAIIAALIVGIYKWWNASEAFRAGVAVIAIGVVQLFEMAADAMFWLGDKIVDWLIPRSLRSSLSSLRSRIRSKTRLKARWSGLATSRPA